MADVKIQIPQHYDETKFRETTMKDDFSFGNNVAGAHKNVRLGFLRKVYGILTVQLICTCIVAGIIVMVDDINSYMKASPGMLMFTMFGSFASLIALMVLRSQVPANYILLTVFVSFSLFFAIN